MAPVALVFLAVVAQEVVFDDRNHHFLRTDAAVNEIQPAALHLDADALSRRKAFVFGIAVEEFYRKKILRLNSFFHNSVTSADLDILIALGGLVNLFVLFQGTVGIQKSVVGGDQDICPAEFIGDDAHHVFDFIHRLHARAEDRLVEMSRLVDGVVIDVNDIHSPDQRLTVGALHADDVLVFQRDALGIRAFEKPVAVGCLGGLSVREDCHTFGLAGFQCNGQFLVGQQRRHAELGNGREYAADAAERHLALGFAPKLFGQFLRDFIPHRVGDNDIHLAVRMGDSVAVEIALSRHFQNPSVIPQLFGADVRPVSAEFSEEPATIQALDLLHDRRKQVGQFGMIGFQARGIRLVKLPVIAVHDVIGGGVLLPDLLWQGVVESGGMGFIKCLHIGKLQNAFIEMLQRLIPDAGAPFFHRLCNEADVNQMVADVLHQLDKNHLVNAGEHLGAEQIGYFKFIKDLGKVQLIFQ